MTSRDTILQAIRQIDLPAQLLPDPPAFAMPGQDLVAAFRTALGHAAGHLLEGPDAAATLRARFPPEAVIASTLPDFLPGTLDLAAVTDPHDLAGLDLLVCRGVLGVAENGAVWVTEDTLVHRAAPYLTQHLALVLDRATLVPDLHAAYASLGADLPGFGAFITGPSKTADIEQALVIGAHGPRSLTVVLT